MFGLNLSGGLELRLELLRLLSESLHSVGTRVLACWVQKGRALSLAECCRIFQSGLVNRPHHQTQALEGHDDELPESKVQGAGLEGCGYI